MLKRSPRWIAHYRSNRMMPRPRPPARSFYSIGKLTLAPCTRRLMRFAPKIRRRSRVSPMCGSFALWQNTMPRRQKWRLPHLATPHLATTRSQFNAAFGRGLLARMIKDEAKARSAFAAIRPEQEKIVQAQRIWSRHFASLRLIDAGLGRKEEALREIRRAVELMPIEKDSINGSRRDPILRPLWPHGSARKISPCKIWRRRHELPGFVSLRPT